MWNLVNKYLKSFLTTIGYNLIYFFSYFQIKYNNLNKKLICNSKQENVLKYELYDEVNGIKKIKDEKYDCMIVTRDTGNYPYDKKIINKKRINKNINFSEENEWKTTKYKFLSLIVIFSEEETYDIKLHNKMENYYILGNIIDEYFIRYYLEKYYNLKITPNIMYVLQLIDENVKVNIVDMEQNIILLENEYLIK